MPLLRTLFDIKSPSAVFMGTAPPTPRWVRAFWAIYDAAAATVWAVFRAVLVVIPLGLLLRLIAGV